MGQSAEELRREIELTRGDLSEDLEAIGDRVSPRRMVERRTNRIKDRVQGGSSRVKGGFGTARERVFGRVEQVRGGASGAAGGVASAAGSAVDTVKTAPQLATEGAQGNPLAAGAVAFGLGFLAAGIFPGSQTEAQAAERLGEAARPLTEGVAEAAREVATATKEAGREAAQELKESASEHAQQVKQTAAEEKQAVQG